VFTRIQPIAIRNVLDYLVAALAMSASVGRILEIGGRDVLTYAEMMTGYARARGLTRRLLAVPVLTPRPVVLLGASRHAHSGEYCPTPHQRIGQ